MNEKTRQSLDKAKSANGSLISKQDFIKAVKDAFSPEHPLPKSELAPSEFDNPYVGYVIRQSLLRVMPNPLMTRIQWFGVDDSLGYVVLSNHLFLNGGTAKDLTDVLKAVHKKDGYILVGEPENTPQS